MSAYEMMYIARPTLDDEALEALVEKLTGVITEQGGAVDEIDKMGKKRLAYEIDDIREGHYSLMIFNGPADLPAELDRVVRLTDEILRHLIVKHVPVSQTTPRAPVSRPVPKPVERPRPAGAPAPARPEASAGPVSPPIPAPVVAAEAAADKPAEAEAPAVAADAPVDVAPAVEAPAVEAPADEAPAAEAPAVEAPAAGTPVAESPAPEAPAAEPAEESTDKPEE